MRLSLVRLSRKLAYALRHHPEQFGLKPDRRGFVPIREVELKLGIPEDVLRSLASTSPRQRFEIRGGSIRARYGHSFPVQLDIPPTPPPRYLFHGTSPRLVTRILEEGLRPMGRQYVHLSKSREMALEVGLRHHPRPAIIRVRGLEAHLEGVAFFDTGDVVLTRWVPPRFLDAD